MNKNITLSIEAIEELRRIADGRSFDATIRELVGLGPRPIKEKLHREGKIDARKKYPVLDMQPGDQILVPWNRDENGFAQIGGINAAVARCNRMPGRKYRSFSTSQGLQINRLE